MYSLSFQPENRNLLKTTKKIGLFCSTYYVSLHSAPILICYGSCKDLQHDQIHMEKTIETHLFSRAHYSYNSTFWTSYWEHKYGKLVILVAHLLQHIAPLSITATFTVKYPKSQRFGQTSHSNNRDL